MQGVVVGPWLDRGSPASRTTRPWLVVAALVVSLACGPLTAVAWNEGGAEEDRPATEWPILALAHKALDASGLDLEVVYHVSGALQGVSMVPVAFAMLRASQRWPMLRSLRVAAWACAVGTFAMTAAYAVGFGFPLDLAALLVAAVACTVAGINVLRKGLGPRPLGFVLAATPIAAGVGFWWVMGYVPGFVAIGLALVWTPAAWLMARSARAQGPPAM